MNLCYNFLFLIFKIFKNLKMEMESAFINNKFLFIYFNVQKKIFYIKIIFSDWVTDTSVNFSGMTGRALYTGYFKINFLKIVRSQKKLYLNESVQILTGHPVYRPCPIPHHFFKRACQLNDLTGPMIAKPVKLLTNHSWFNHTSIDIFSGDVVVSIC
jgi:hypothetical protein